MKKIKFSKKLSLNKEVVVTLSGNQMNQVNGGILHDFYKWIIKHNETHPNKPTESYVSGGCSNMCTQWQCNKI
ncbi:MAG: class I lanthipeptide [Sphingobacteriaceae bacterium]|jgi:hypothetical protein